MNDSTKYSRQFNDLPLINPLNPTLETLFKKHKFPYSPTHPGKSLYDRILFMFRLGVTVTVNRRSEM